MGTIKIRCLCVLLVVSGSCFADGEPPVQQPEIQDNWHYIVNLVYSSRTLSGEVVSRSPISDDKFGELIATGDSMNVGSSNGFILAVGAQYKKWALGLNYLPTSFSGQGFAIVEVGGSGGVNVRTPLDTDINVDMLLGSASYNFIQTANTLFGVGFGLGQTSIDLNIVPEVGNSIVYQGNQPFGFLNLHMANNHERFLYGFSLSGISTSFDGVAVNYSDYKIDLGYRLDDRKVKFDIVGGYRMVNFAIDIETDGKQVKTDVRLEGPFLGVNVIF